MISSFRIFIIDPFFITSDYFLLLERLLFCLLRRSDSIYAVFTFLPFQFSPWDTQSFGNRLLTYSKGFSQFLQRLRRISIQQSLKITRFDLRSSRTTFKVVQIKISCQKSAKPKFTHTFRKNFISKYGTYRFIRLCSGFSADETHSEYSTE